MGRIDKIIVPATFVIALVGTLAATASWVRRPIPEIGLRVGLGPPGIVPHRTYGLRFTPRNPLSGHILTMLVPSQRRCVDVTIVNESLTYVQPLKACRLSSGAYGVNYRFPRLDDYVIFVEMHPVGGRAHAFRIAFRQDLCWLRRGQNWHGTCRRHPAVLRGLESIRSKTYGDLTVIMSTPSRALHAGTPEQLTFLFLRHGRVVTDMNTVYGQAGLAMAISHDTQHFTRLTPESGQVAQGHVAGSITFTATFNEPSIYRVFGAFRYGNKALRTDFVVDVDPPPTATPNVG